MRLPTRRGHRYAGAAVRSDRIVTTSVRTWTPSDDSYPITLIGVLHMATADYYAKIAELANADPDAVVLYEGVRPSNIDNDGAGQLSSTERQAVNVDLQAGPSAAHRQTADLLGLALHEPTLLPHYSRPNWHRADLDQIDLMRAIGIDPAARTAINGRPLLVNTAITAQAQTTAAVARRGDASPVNVEEERTETQRLTRDIVADTAATQPGRMAAAIARLARAAETDPATRLQMMDHERTKLRWAIGGVPWPRRFLSVLIFAVPRLIISLRRSPTQATAQHRHKVIHDWRVFHVMSMAMRHARTAPVVVIYGAAHTQAQSEFLARNGCTQTDVSWLEGLSLANPKGKQRKRVLAELTALLAARAEQRTRHITHADRNTRTVDNQAEAAGEPEGDTAPTSDTGATPVTGR